MNQAPSLIETAPSAIRSVTRAEARPTPRALNTRTRIAVGDAAGLRVGGMQPDIVAVDAAEHGLVAVDGMRACPRFRRQQFERIGRAVSKGRDPGGNRRHAAEPVRVGVGGHRHRVDLDLARGRSELVVLGVADFAGEGDGIFGRREAGDTVLGEAHRSRPRRRSVSSRSQSVSLLSL